MNQSDNLTYVTANIKNTNQTSKNSGINADKIKKILLKLVIGSGLLLGTLIVVLVFLYLTKLDRKILPITITGTVTDNISKNPIYPATVTINNTSVQTLQNGIYSITGYFDDQIDLKVNSNLHEAFNQQVSLSRSFLTSRFTADFQLNPKELGFLKGKIVAEPGHSFVEDKILIDLTEIPILQDGTFTANSIKKGEILFEYQSKRYKDIEKTVTIIEGQNQIEDLIAVPSGDVNGIFKDWVNDSSPIKATIQADNVFQEQIMVLDDGTFLIKDLEIDKEYTFRISHSNYLTRDYKVTIAQGENQIFNLRMIPNDIFASYLKRIDGYHIYKSDLDGQNEVKLTNVRSLAPSAFYHDNFKVFFRDDYESIRGTNSGNLPLAYEIDLTSGVQTRLTSTTTPLQNIYYFYSAQKLINIVSKRSGSILNYKVELRNINGEVPVEITSGNNLNFTNLQLSKNKGFVFYTLRKENSKVDDLYIWSEDSGLNELLITEEEINIFDVSTNGEKILMIRKNSNTGFEDLVIFDVDSRSTKILLQNHDGNNYKFDQDSKDLFYFYAKRDGRANIFKYDLNTNQTDRVTFLNPDSNISGFYIVDRYLFYTVDKKLFVLDKNAPVGFKQIAENVED